MGNRCTGIKLGLSWEDFLEVSRDLKSEEDKVSSIFFSEMGMVVRRYLGTRERAGRETGLRDI